MSVCSVVWVTAFDTSLVTDIGVGGVECRVLGFGEVDGVNNAEVCRSFDVDDSRDVIVTGNVDDGINEVNVVIDVGDVVIVGVVGVVSVVVVGVVVVVGGGGGVAVVAVVAVVGVGVGVGVVVVGGGGVVGGGDIVVAVVGMVLMVIPVVFEKHLNNIN